MDIFEWADKHGVTDSALAELHAVFAEGSISTDSTHANMSEGGVQSRVRLGMSKLGMATWRNNVGGFKADNGQFVRYGLCNDTKQLNEAFKSADLIGIRPVMITQEWVGHVIGQFVSIEVKEGDWAYSGKGREAAQVRWMELVNRYGGYAKIINNEGDL